MKHNKTLIWIVMALMLAAVLTGCGKTTPADKPAEPVDIEALYEQGMAAIAKNAGEELVLFPEESPEFLNEEFPGILDIEMTQYKFALSPVTNGPVEVDIVEVKNHSDVQKVMDIFQARVDKLSEDDGYPENAAAWKNNSHITSRGNLVILAVLTDYFGEVPAEFILD
ncbi:MAG: DUF4358 domain-containing protein [Oscillospiraceae bacterium]|nr:DUF4358 domain-containing protein [Oscillospiraceae bacterium]